MSQFLPKFDYLIYKKEGKFKIKNKNKSSSDFIFQDLRLLKKQLSTMTVRDIEFLESALIVAKDNSKLEHQYEIDEVLLKLRKRKNKDYNPEKIVGVKINGTNKINFTTTKKR